MSAMAWFQFFAVLAADAAIALLIATVAVRFVRPFWQRTIWHAAMVTLLGLLVVECSGISARMPSIFPGSKQSPAAKRIVAESIPPQPDLLHPQGADTADDKLRLAHLSQKPHWWPLGLWLTGCALFLVRPLGSRVVFFLLRHHRRPLPDQSLLSRVETLAKRIGLKSRIRITESETLRGPVAFGLFRREICLPAHFTQSFSYPQQDAMLVHELEHLRGHDPIWYLLTEITVALWWWQPLGWLARRKLQTATEEAADEASALFEDGPSILADCLVQIAKHLQTTRSFNLLGIEGNHFGSSLARRVTRLLHLAPGHSSQSSGPWRSRLIHLSAIALLLFLATAASTVNSLLAIQPPGLAQAILASPSENNPANNKKVLAQAAPAGLPSKPDSDDAGALLTKSFKVDPYSITQNLLKKKRPAISSLSYTNVVSELTAFLGSTGVDLSPPKNIFFAQTTGILTVRATSQDLWKVEQALQELNNSPTQLTIECKFVEFSYDNLPQWLEVFRPDNKEAVQTATASSTNLAKPEFVSILTPLRNTEIQRELNTRAGSDILSTPRVTTLSGRQAQIKVVDVTRLAINLEGQKNADDKPIIQEFEFGPAVDIIPRVASDGIAISMTIVPSILEFLGYENRVAQTKPLLRLRKAPATLTVWDGQTALLGLGPIEEANSKGLPTKPAKKYRALFVTPTIIDPAGNRVHPETTLPFRNEGVPPQK